MLEKIKQLGKQSDVMMAVVVVGILMMMILPVPPVLMDLFLAVSITLSLVVLLTTLYITKPLEFSVFPSILLVLTLYRLSLNIATTRLILINGHEGGQAAGNVIMSFGQFVVGGNYVVGVIVFLILVIINFIVITKGAGRIAEVAARFVLDSMPGKQMAIDADLNAGIISDSDARNRRKEIQEEADFYGAMDGASKFVRGDAIAGLLITAINIIAGFIIGVAQKGLPVGQAATTYTLLTVGDGLVSQIPALISSTAAGILVTRSAANVNLGQHLFKQLFSYWRVLGVVGLFLLGFAMIPGMPSITFILLSFSLLSVAYFAKKKEIPVLKKTQAEPKEPVAPEVTEAEKLESMLPVDLLELEVGYGLINLVDSRQGGELLNRITGIRRQFVTRLGIIIPPIHIRDNLQLGANRYSIRLKGAEIAGGDVLPDHRMAMNPGDVVEEIEGVDTVEPAFGLPARWIPKDLSQKAEVLGYTVVDVSTVIATHLSEVLRQNAAELVGRQELQNLLDVFSKSSPKLVEELIPAMLSLGEVLKVVKNLLREEISVRDLRTILESLADLAAQTKNTEVLSELVRQRLARSITNSYKSPEGYIHAIMFEKDVEDMFRSSQQMIDDEIQVVINPEQAKNILKQIEERIQEAAAAAIQPVLLVPPEIRMAIFNFVRRFLPDMSVLSHREIDGSARIQLVGTVGI